MKSLKKVLATFMALVLIVVFLASCTKSKPSSNLNKDGVYTPTKDLELTVWDTQGTDYVAKELGKNVVEDWLVEKTKVKVTNIYGNGGGQWDPLLTKLVAGKNLPDIIHCGAGQGSTHFAKLDQLGQVWELTPEMIQTYAPEVWKRTPARYWEEIKIDGKILGIPYNVPTSPEAFQDLPEGEIQLIMNMKTTPVNTVTSSGSGVIWIRDDILKMIYPNAKSYDELKALLEERGKPIGDELMDVPIHSTKEFIDFMYKVKDLNLKENGKTVYTFGFTGGDNWEALSWLGADMYGYKGHYYSGTWNEAKQEMEIPIAGEMIRQAAKTENQMINDEVIDPESLAHNMTQFEEKVLNGRYAMMYISMLGDPASVNKQLEDAGKPYRYRPFLTNVPAQPDYPMYQTETQWTDSLCLLKTLSEEEVYQVLNWMNVQYTDEYEDIKNWGPKEAGLYRETADGKREFTDERFTKYFLEGDRTAMTAEDTLGLQGPEAEGYKVGGLFGVRPTMYSKWTPEIYLHHETYAPTMFSGFKFAYDSQYTKNIKTFPQCQVWSACFAEIPEVVSFWGAREQWESQFKLAFAAPVKDFDAKWDQAIAELNKIVNIEETEKKMTAVAKPLADEIKARE